MPLSHSAKKTSTKYRAKKTAQGNIEIPIRKKGIQGIPFWELTYFIGGKGKSSQRAFKRQYLSFQEGFKYGGDVHVSQLLTESPEFNL